MLRTDRVQQASFRPSAYRERLLPGAAWWAVVLALVAMVAIAYGAALGTLVGVLAGAGLGLIVFVTMLRTSPIISVSGGAISCGAAHLPAGAWGPPQALGRDAVTAVRRGHDASVGDRVYVAMPTWMSGSAVVIPLLDADDPHSAWLIGTRNPDGLMRALQDDSRTP